MTAADLLRDALKREHARQLELASHEDRKDLALSHLRVRRDLDNVLFQIEAHTPHWRREALGVAVFALAGVDP